MSQASAQREPSMEEILSSIRRIIEDSDTTSESAGASDDTGGDDKTMPGDEVVEEIDAFLEELSDNKPSEDVIKPEPANQDQSTPMKDVTPVAAAPAAKPHAAANTEHAGKAADKPVISEVQAKPAAPAAKPEPRPELKPVEVSAKPAAVAPSAEAEKPADAAAKAEPKPQQPAAVASPAKEPSPARVQPIVSEKTGRQVQAAFGELNEAFQKSRAASFDQMAEEMIRPMLQDWLDNNLPTLVERLVREEIERVARGE